MSRPFTARHRLRFAHCDPAGIAYYPRLLELNDAVIEDWTEAVIGVPRRVLHLDQQLALPTVALATRFDSACRLGDRLDFSLTVGRIGDTSIDLAVEVMCDGVARFTVTLTQVLVKMDNMRAKRWPADWRARIEETL